MGFYLVKVVTTFVLPPGQEVVLGLLAGLLFVLGWRRLAGTCALLALALLYAFSTPMLANGLMTAIEPAHALRAADLRGRHPGAIVVLGGGRRRDAIEYGTDVPNGRTLQRLRYAVHVYRQTGLPILVSGGRVFGGGLSEAQAMRQALEQDFHVPVRWVEGESRNTEENARFSARLLARAGIHEVLLVTTAVHMRRAVASFEAAGMRVIPAPTVFVGGPVKGFDLFDWLPNAGALGNCAIALHEWLGLLWYRMRYF